MEVKNIHHRDTEAPRKSKTVMLGVEVKNIHHRDTEAPRKSKTVMLGVEVKNLHHRDTEAPRKSKAYDWGSLSHFMVCFFSVPLCLCGEGLLVL
jgi:hypothetical protein